MNNKLNRNIKFQTNEIKSSVDKIPENVDRYITKRKHWDAILKVSSRVLFISAVVLVFFVNYDFLISYINSLFISPVDRILQLKSTEIKQSAIADIPDNYIEFYTNPVNAQKQGTDHIAYLIHKYNNDFYGKTYRLSLKDEKTLFSHITFAGVDLSDLAHLNRPFNGDTTQTVKEWLLSKTTGSAIYNTDYNPIFEDILFDIEENKRLYNRQLKERFTLTVSDTIKKYLNTAKNDYSEDSVLIKSIKNILLKYPYLLLNEIETLRNIKEKEQELYLRLALFQVYLGKEYNAHTSEQMFGWLNADFKGKDSFKFKRSRYNSKSPLYASAQQFKQRLKESNILYKRLNLSDDKIHLYNPLKMSLEVKTVGLFSARRKSEYGRIYKHKGVDLMADEGIPVYPVKAGFVVFAGDRNNGHGNHIKIWHDNRIVSLYSHLKNDRVWQRTVQKFRRQGPFWIDTQTRLASVGSSGNIPKNDPQYGYAHLHLEVYINDKLQNPLNLFDEAYKVSLE